MKQKDIPEVLTFRPNPEDREMLKELVRIKKPRMMSMLIREALKDLLEKLRSKQ